MATAAKRKKTGKRGFRPGRFVLRWALRGMLIVAAFFGLLILGYSVFDPPVTPYILSESRRLGGVERDWVPLEAIAPAMARSAVAAEDANFCLHWGFDLGAIRDAIEDGGTRGASTISQQVAKNVFLWHRRSWARKALEAGLTPAIEAAWSKRRILEVYLNVAEFGEGLFGVEAAARHHFGVTAADLSETQASRLAAVLPAPKSRSASDPTPWLRQRAAAIRGGAATVRADGRDDCFAG